MGYFVLHCNPFLNLIVGWGKGGCGGPQKAASNWPPVYQPGVCCWGISDALTSTETPSSSTAVEMESLKSSLSGLIRTRWDGEVRRAAEGNQPWTDTWRHFSPPHLLPALQHIPICPSWNSIPSLCGSIMYYMIPSNECRVDSPLILYADVQYMGNGKKRGRRNRKENVCSFCFDLNTEICFLVGNRQSTEEDDVQWSDDSWVQPVIYVLAWRSFTHL